MIDMETILLIFLTELSEKLSEAVANGVEYAIKKVVDETGRAITQIVQSVDNDGDGVVDTEIILHEFDIPIPDFDSGYCIVNDGDVIGIGLPQFEIIDGLDMTSYIDISNPLNYPYITANDDGYLLDMDGDGDNDEAVIPLSDFNGDGVEEWGRVVDEDDNGVPDASPEAPFYPVGSDEYNQLITDRSGVPSIIVMSQDGTMTVYDTNGQITAEDCDTAYSLWVSENGIMDKRLDNYSVTEGLLLCMLLLAGAWFVRSLFKRKDVYR